MRHHLSSKERKSAFNFYKRNRPTFFGSILLSLSLHLLALILLHSYPHTKVSIGRTNHTVFTQAQNRYALKKAFKGLISQKELNPSSHSSLPSLEPNPEGKLTLSSSFSLPHQRKEIVLVEEKKPSSFSPTSNTPSFTLSIQEPTSLIEALSTAASQFKKEKQPSFSLKSLSPIEEKETTFALSLPGSSTENEKSPFSPTPISLSLQETSLLKNEEKALTLSTKKTSSTLSFLPTIGELNIASYGEDFAVDISFLPQEKEGNYIFAITLIPKPNLVCEKIPQNYTFLIDRSNSIQKDRLTATRQAVQKSLAHIGEEDHFNIFAFDSQIERLSSIPLNGSSLCLQHAKQFLLKLKLASFFSFSNVFKPLYLTVPQEPSQEEVHSVILLTNGEGFSSKGKSLPFVHEWSYRNNGKVSLYTVSLSEDKNRGFLDLLSTLNKGKQIFSPTKAGLKRKLSKLIKSISSPIAKDLFSTAIATSSDTDIKLYPPAAQLPHLYLNEPYVIMGTTNKLDDFTLFLQGKGKNGWIHIKKKISFTEGKQGGPSLLEKWAIERSHKCYEDFLSDGSQKHLQEAAEILEPYGIYSFQ